MPTNELHRLGVSSRLNANTLADVLRLPFCEMSNDEVAEFHVAEIGLIAVDSGLDAASPLFFVEEIFRTGVPEYAE